MTCVFRVLSLDYCDHLPPPPISLLPIFFSFILFTLTSLDLYLSSCFLFISAGDKFALALSESVFLTTFRIYRGHFRLQSLLRS